jgi:hypothetical protein
MEPNMAVIKLCVSSLWKENRSRLKLLLEGTPAFRSVISVPTAPSDHVRNTHYASRYFAAWSTWSSANEAMKK